MASHTAAAAAWNIGPVRRMVHVTVPPENRRRQNRLIVIHRLADLRPEDVANIDGLPVTSVARTLVDLGAVVPIDALRRSLIAAERERLIDLAAIDDALAGAGRRTGPAALRTVLRHYDARWQHLRSSHELALLDLVARHGLPEPLVDAGVLERYIADFLWPDVRLVVEVDSARFHSTPQDRRADARRDAHLRRAGFTVMRVTERELHRTPEVVAGRLGIALARGAS